jgi:flagellar protein FlbD
MTRLRFTLQPALDAARARENDARVLLARAVAHAAGERERLAALDAVERLSRAPSATSSSASSDAATCGAVLDAHLRALAARRRCGRATLALADAAVDAVRADYARHARRHRALEALRDRRAAAAADRAVRREEAELDEANAARRGASARQWEEGDVISLSRPNGRPVIVNADLIETVERTDDGTTTVALTTGNVLAVMETPDAVRDAVVAYRRSLRAPS